MDTPHQEPGNNEHLNTDLRISLLGPNLSCLRLFSGTNAPFRSDPDDEYLAYDAIIDHYLWIYILLEDKQTCHIL